MIDPSRTPVIIGVGQSEDRTDDVTQAQDAFALMLAALREADRDAGGGALDRLDTLDLVRLFSAPMAHIPDAFAQALPGLRSPAAFRYGHGNTPMLILNMAANRIAAGEAEICAVAGAEAYRTEKRRAAEAQGLSTSPDLMKSNLVASTSDTGNRYGVVSPIEIYPLFENAMRAAWGQSLAESQAESAQIWSDFSKVAASNPHAWLRRPLSPAEILEITPHNRRLHFPYSMLMVANNSVNQGAAVILASLAAARRLGVPEDQIIFVGAGAAAAESHDFRERHSYHRSPSLECTIEAALTANGIEAGDCDHLELYSCFPCVPKHARRTANFRSDVPLTVSGGLTFAGGPIRNYMMHATAAMTQKLRESGRFGFLFGNGGYMTEAHAVVLGRAPFDVDLPHDVDRQAEADARRGPVPDFDEDYSGTGSIETYTVAYGPDGEARYGTVIGRAPDGRRFIGRVPGSDRDAIRLLTSGEIEPVGLNGSVSPGQEGLRHWRMS